MIRTFRFPTGERLEATYRLESFRTLPPARHPRLRVPDLSAAVAVWAYVTAGVAVALSGVVLVLGIRRP